MDTVKLICAALGMFWLSGGNVVATIGAVLFVWVINGTKTN
jgi:predicted ABC-type exoprotein transport system permease subunit